MPKRFISTLLLLTAGAALGATLNLTDRIERPLRYQPEGRDFVITNGAEFFNRPLYGGNTAFRVDAGDRPEFLLYLPGRGGNVRLGIRAAAGAKWLHDTEQIVARYRPGAMLYQINDPLLVGATLQVTALAPAERESFVLRVDLHGGGAPVELIWACGGASGERGRRNGDIGTENVPISQFFQLEPGDCRSNTVTLEGNRFTLRGPRGAVMGLGPAGTEFTVADSARWNSISELPSSVTNTPALPIVVARTRLMTEHPVFLGFQGGAGPSAAGFTSESLPRLFEAAETRRQTVAERVVADTPDPFINAAVAALNVAADGVWDEPTGTVQHGAVAWRSRLLGWRGGYGNDALGWHDRARRHFAYWATRQNTNPVPPAILPADPTANLSRNEPSLHSNGDMSNSHYDMNMVYVDALFRHLMWTGDLEFARQVWPVIERHLAWERRLFRRPFGPDGLPLYEGYACIWASDDLAYHGGGATHASAYNYYHNRLAGKLATLLRKDPAPYEQEAELIRRAMRRELWLADRGWFAEWKDLLGLQLVHPNAALWTFYHTIDSGAADPMEAWQMTRFVDTQIPHFPIRGSGVPDGCYTLSTTSWMPYTWSLNNVVMAEVQHTALAYWQAGRADEAFRLFKGSLLDSMYLGLCPGNVGMASYFDMARGESQRDFADAVGTTSRALIEGLFGVKPDLLAGELLVRPGFPADWPRASLKHPDFDFEFERSGSTETYSVTTRLAKPAKLRLEVPALLDRIETVTVNDQVVPSRLRPEVGGSRVLIESAAASKHVVRINWRGASLAKPPAEAVVAAGSDLTVRLGAATVDEQVTGPVADPQHALSETRIRPTEVQARAGGALGHRTVFVAVHQGDFTWWEPVPFVIRPDHEIVPAEIQDAEHLRFRLRNNAASALDREVEVQFAGRREKILLTVPAFGTSPELALNAVGLLPGGTRVFVDLGNGDHVEGIIVNWKLVAPGAANWSSLDLEATFNDRVAQVFRNEYLSPRSPYCSLAIPKQGIGSWCHPEATFEVDDRGLRTRSLEGHGRLATPMGVPFATPGDAGAKNIAFTSQWDNYPREVTVPLAGRALHLYLLLAGSSNPMQSRFDNGEVIVTYADGSTERLALHNPTTWWPIDQDYYLDDFAFRRPEPIPPRVDLRTGQVRVLDPVTSKGNGGVVRGGAANVLDLPLNPEKELKSLTVRTLANEVVIGLMAATLAK